RAPPAPIYTRDGYGGFVPKPPAATPQPTVAPAGAGQGTAPGVAEYNEGRYAEAEQQAERAVAAATQQSPRAPERKETARARWVLAFSAARRQDLPLARRRFAELQSAAAGELWTLEDPRPLTPAETTPSAAESADDAPEDVTPDRPVSPTGAPLPTLEEEAAYQHAVLTQAVAREAAVASGKKVEAGKNYSPEAERELVEFMRRYPESPLIHAAVRRVGMMHGGDIPKPVEKIWQEAMQAGQTRQHARDRERSLCGPEVLAEVLRRTAARELPTVRELAQELKTDHQGTTLQAVAAGAERRGLETKGYRLTWDGLWRLTRGKDAPSAGATQLIALVQPGHYVLIEDVTAGWVTVWDPSGKALGEGAARRYPRPGWERVWSGVALRVSSKSMP
ncbi:MAG: cysteine peptidase family C39 domain-containing protein, partial [Actinomycetota bacterium]